MKVVLAAVIVAVVCLFGVAEAADGLAYAKINSGSLAGELFFVQNSTDNTVSVKLTLTSGYTVGYNYSFFVHTYGDLFGASTHGGCFSGQSSSFAMAQPDVSSNYIAFAQLAAGVISLTGDTTSIVGRTVAVYENLAADTCTAATAATPVGRGVVGVAWPRTSANQNPAGAPLTSNPTSAYAQIIGTTGTYGDNSGISGSVYFQALSDGTMTVLVQISGVSITAGQHALHVHEYGDLSLSNATSMNGHWNPFGRYHGPPTQTWRHAGDMGNVTADSNGYIFSQWTFDQLTFQGAASIIGRGVVLHTLKDDGNPLNLSTSVGNAGGRIARGVIGVSSRSVPYPSSSSSSSGSASTSTSSTSGSTSSSTSSSSTSSSSTGINAASSVASVSVSAVVALALAVVFAFFDKQ